MEAASLKLIWKQKKRDLGLTQEKAAHIMGWSSQGAVAQYLNGKIPLNTDAKMKFAGLLKVSPISIWPSFVGPAAPEVDSDVAITKNRVPLLNWVSAGDTVDSFQPEDSDVWLVCPVDHSLNTYALTVVGDSMTAQHGSQRSYPVGATIFVDPLIPPQNGDRVIVKLEESPEVTFKQLVTDMGKSYLKPINTQYSTIEMPDTAVICGVVIGCWVAN